VTQKLFGQVWENPGKILHPRHLPASIPMMKVTSGPFAHRLKGQRRKGPRHAPFSGVSVHIILHALFSRCCSVQCVTAMNISCQWSPKTDKFMTAKISGIALKQGSRTHSVLHQRSSQLQKCKAGRIAVDQKVCGWDGGHPGLTV